MAPNLLVLGGTTEATALCNALAERGFRATVSFAGRVERPVRQPLPQRIGGFGGPDGLAAYLTEHAITHVIDATHPFARQMSENAVAACQKSGVPLLAFTRPPWTPQPGDNWTSVPDIDGAVAALDRPATRVMLAVGRMNLPAFEANPQHFYLLRLVDPPKTPPGFPDHHVIVARGPFNATSDEALMREHRIDLVVSKNAGGTGGAAKIEAARNLGLPVIMIDRPHLPDRDETYALGDVIAWIDHGATDLGV